MDIIALIIQQDNDISIKLMDIYQSGFSGYQSFIRRQKSLRDRGIPYYLRTSPSSHSFEAGREPKTITIKMKYFMGK